MVSRREVTSGGLGSVGLVFRKGKCEARTSLVAQELKEGM